MCVCVCVRTSVSACVTELVMWTERLMSGQQYKEHVVLTWGLNGLKGGGLFVAMIARLCHNVDPRSCM